MIRQDFDTVIWVYLLGSECVCLRCRGIYSSTCSPNVRFGEREAVPTACKV